MLYPGLIATVIFTMVGIGLAFYTTYNQNENMRERQHEQRTRRKTQTTETKTNKSWSIPSATNTECNICFEKVTIRHHVQLSCGHFFHFDCIKKWRESGLTLRNKCVLCLQEYSNVF